MHTRTLHRPKPRRLPATQPTTSRTISRAASIMYEPEILESHKGSQSPLEAPKPSSSVQLVPANTHSSMFPSAFRTVVIEEQERPGSSCSNGSSSTVSDNGPATPRSPGSSWLSWITGSTTKTLTRPASPAMCVSPASGASLSPLRTDADDFGFTVAVSKANTNSVGDHWADTKREPLPMAANRRTISKRVRWDDDESVKFSWF